MVRVDGEVVESGIEADAFFGFGEVFEEDVTFLMGGVDCIGVFDSEAFEEPVGVCDILACEIGNIFVTGCFYGAPCWWEAGVIDCVSEVFEFS